jgi:hypothetical protein
MVPPKSSIVLFIVEKSRYDMSAAAKIKKAQELKDFEVRVVCCWPGKVVITKLGGGEDLRRWRV